MQRWQTFAGRLAKLARAALATKDAGHLAAASALSAGAYGSVCTVMTAAHVNLLRRWMRFACWKGGSGADFGLLVWTGTVPQRADPLLHLVQRSVRIVALLVQDAVLTPPEVDILWRCSGDCNNPVAATRQLHKLIGVTMVQGNLPRGADPLNK